MAGEKIEVIKGGVVVIRPVATKKAAAGDFAYFGKVPGFWLHDVKKNDAGDLCIHAPIVSIPNNGKAHKAGAIFIWGPDGIDYSPKATNLQNKSPAHTNIVYRNASAKDARVFVVWGLY